MNIDPRTLFPQTLTGFNVNRVRRLGLILLILHAPLLGIDLYRLVTGVLAVHSGYRYLFFAHLALMSALGGLVFAAAATERLPEHRREDVQQLLWYVAAFILLCLTAIISSIDQLIHGQITVYLLGCIGIAVAFYMPLGKSLPLYLTGHVLFLAGITLLQDNADVLAGHYINGTLTAVISIVVTKSLHDRYQSTYEHARTVEAQQRELRRLAIEDSLTGLRNRRYITGRLVEEFHRAHRYGRPLSVAISDIDYFKRVNDSYSHQIGDKVLQIIARIYAGHIRSVDFLARYGGEEFLILFPETLSDEAAAVCDRIRVATEAYPWDEIRPGMAVTVSFGIASNRRKSEHQSLIDAADTCLYEAKRLGRNRVVSDQYGHHPGVPGA